MLARTTSDSSDDFGSPALPYVFHRPTSMRGMPCAPPATPVAGSASLGPHRTTIHVHAAPPGPPQPTPASADGATAASSTQKPPEEGWLPYFKVCGGVVAISLMSFSYAAAHAQAGTTSTMQINDPECSWMEEMRRLNPVGCLKPSFDKSITPSREAAPQALPSPLAAARFPLTAPPPSPCFLRTGTDRRPPPS